MELCHERRRFVERRILSENDSYVICLPSNDGPVILHASRGFEDFFGFTDAELKGTNLCNGPHVVQENACAIEAILKEAKPTPKRGNAKLNYFQVYMALECDAVLNESPPKRMGLCLQINCNRDGKVMVCKVTIVVCVLAERKDPVLLCIYDDATVRTSVKQIISASNTGLFFKLVREHRKVSEEQFVPEDLCNYVRQFEFLSESTCGGSSQTEQVSDLSDGKGSDTDEQGDALKPTQNPQEANSEESFQDNPFAPPARVPPSSAVQKVDSLPFSNINAVSH